MAFRKTNRIEKDDHQVVVPTEKTASSLKEETWDDVLKARIAAELEALTPEQKQRRRESGYFEG